MSAVNKMVLVLSILLYKSLFFDTNSWALLKILIWSIIPGLFVLPFLFLLKILSNVVIVNG